MRNEDYRSPEVFDSTDCETSAPDSSPEARREISLNTITARELAAQEFPPVTFVVPDYIAQGLTVLAGRPKAGKSWLGLSIAVAVATGGRALGKVKVDTGDVLYLALEDNRRRLQRRLDQLLPMAQKPDRLHLATSCLRLDEGGLKAIEHWCRSVPNPRLVVIDVLSKVRTQRGSNESLYDADYRALTPLKTLADELDVAIIVVHHTNKREDTADPFDSVSGTTGLTGAADTVLILARDGSGTTLYGRGRDIAEIEVALQFDHMTGHWFLLGDASTVRRTDERKAILDALLNADEPLGPSAIADAAEMKASNVRRLVSKMLKAGEIVKMGRGKYRHPSRSDLDEKERRHPDDQGGTGYVGNEVTKVVN
jgi:hypothetical protein